MTSKEQILSRIKQLVNSAESGATVILYGSYARGDDNEQSDFDILILVDKETLSVSDEKRIKYPLYDLEFDTGKIISPVVITKSDWESRHRITPFYENIKKEGLLL